MTPAVSLTTIDRGVGEVCSIRPIATNADLEEDDLAFVEVGEESPVAILILSGIEDQLALKSAAFVGAAEVEAKDEAAEDTLELRAVGVELGDDIGLDAGVEKLVPLRRRGEAGDGSQQGGVTEGVIGHGEVHEDGGDVALEAEVDAFCGVETPTESGVGGEKTGADVTADIATVGDALHGVELHAWDGAVADIVDGATHDGLFGLKLVGRLHAGQGASGRSEQKQGQQGDDGEARRQQRHGRLGHIWVAGCG